ncbi:hypothetical protein Tcan_10133 [Toxocara canis]|uniref:Uncharacterized protein n=1 Tax=Toxocara canis TaxID=6265 RepID=A0A0B2VGG5_TOXCA|nr:hypothetical protein Tcan_10133 [Toxocara canis]
MHLYLKLKSKPNQLAQSCSQQICYKDEKLVNAQTTSAQITDDVSEQQMDAERVKAVSAMGAGLRRSPRRTERIAMVNHSVIEPAPRRHSIMVNRRQNQSDTGTPSSHHIQLQERTSSKITLDEELFDILYAFGLVLFSNLLGCDHRYSGQLH